MSTRRRRKPAHHSSPERWLVSYADFITLLFAFFVVMYSAAQVDKRKVGQLATAIQVAFQQLGAFPTTGNPATLNPTEPGLFSNPPPAGAIPASQGNGDLVSLRKDLEQALAQEISRGEVAVRGGPEGLVISLRELGFFDSGSATLKATSQPAFSRMAELLAKNQYNVRIEGHTDNVPIHNSQFSSNWELSTARATELLLLLIEKYGLPPESLSVAGYGEYHPVAGNGTEVGRAANRRVDVVILRKAPPAGTTSQTQTAAPKLPGLSGHSSKVTR
jgi:chemotaxis protein MotB